MANVTPQPAPIAPMATGGAAQPQSGFDPGPIIAASEQNLADYLNLPVQEIMNRLGIPNVPGQSGQPGEAPKPGEPPAGEQDPAASAMDPSSLISPVTDALSTLGTGIFESMDPTKLMESVSKAIESATSSMSSSAASNGSQLSGQTANGIAKTTQDAAQQGQQIAGQSEIIKANTAQAAAHTGDARAEILQIIATFQATLAKLVPGIPFTIPAIFAAASLAVSTAAAVITKTQGALAGNTAAVNVAGQQIPVTQLIGPGLQIGTGLLSAGLGMVTKGASSGMKAGTDMISKVSSATKDASKTAAKTPTKDYKPLSSGGAKSGGGVGSATPKASLGARMGGGMPGAGIGSGNSAANISSFGAVRGSGAPGMGGPMGSGMGMAPGAGSRGGNANESSGGHTAEILKSNEWDLMGLDNVVAGIPVLGEADPFEEPDVDLRI